MFSRICAFLTALTCVLVLLAGCGDDKNAPIVGRWQATKVKLNGETISFAELDCSDKEFSFNFKEDIVYGGKTEKLSYDSSVLTLCFNYNNEKTQYLFTRVE